MNIGILYSSVKDPFHGSCGVIHYGIFHFVGQFTCNNPVDVGFVVVISHLTQHKVCEVNYMHVDEGQYHHMSRNHSDLTNRHSPCDFLLACMARS